MKLSSKALACGQSPMRKFHPYAVAAAAAGKKIYHLNIGQPDIHTPDALYDAIHNFRTPVLAYAASPGIPELISAIEGYYRNIGVQLSESDILVTTGGRGQLSARRRRRGHRPRAVLSQLPYLHHHGRRRDPSAAYPAGGRLFLRRPRAHRGLHHAEDQGDHDHEPRQPHRHLPDHRADEDAARRCGGARSVSRGRRGLPRVHLRRRAAAFVRQV